MHIAQAMISGVPIPLGAMLIGFIDRHPADKSGLGYAVLFFVATGVEVAWNGQHTRSLPPNWRGKVAFTPTTHASVIGQKGGSAKSKAKSAAARANGKKGGRPHKSDTGS